MGETKKRKAEQLGRGREAWESRRNKEWEELRRRPTEKEREGGRDKERSRKAGRTGD